MSGTVYVRTFPHTDDAFARLVEDAILRLAPTDPEELEALVRATHPAVRIVAQSALGAIGNSIVWYAYRDGVAVPHGDGASPQALEAEAS